RRAGRDAVVVAAAAASATAAAVAREPGEPVEAGRREVDRAVERAGARAAGARRTRRAVEAGRSDTAVLTLARCARATLRAARTGGAGIALALRRSGIADARRAADAADPAAR